MDVAAFIRRVNFLRSMVKPLHKAYGDFRLRHEYAYRASEFRRVFSALQPSSQPRVWHVCLPHHGNLGDRAQAVCIQKWLRDNYPDRELVEVYIIGFLGAGEWGKRRIVELMGKDDLIFFQSGYHFTGESRPEPVYDWFTKTFPNNKSVFLPVTIKFRSNKIKDRIRKRYEDRNVTLIARDKVSYATAQEIFPRLKILLYPDIVTSLIGRVDLPRAQREGVLFCMRNDEERVFTEEKLQALLGKFRDVRHNVIDTNVGMDWRLPLEKYEEAFMSLIRDFSTYKCVVTDRYHGMIFSLISNTPTIVDKTADHKASSGAEQLQEFFPDFLTIPENEDELAEQIRLRLSQEELTVKLPDLPYQLYWSKLKSRI